MNIALILLVAVAWATGSPMPKDAHPEKIVGGTAATRGEFPWMVSVEYLESHICGGSIINPNWIVTAAHCALFGERQGTRFTVVAGDHILQLDEGSEQRRAVEEVIIHPNYNKSGVANDIALMRLSTPLTFGTFIQAANIARDEFTPTGNFVVAGWGITDEDEVDFNDVLLKATVPFVTVETCKDVYGSLIQPGMICAGNGRTDRCIGDDGGPLHSGSLLVGIVGYGYGCARPQYPGLYTSVPYFSSWISENVD